MELGLDQMSALGRLNMKMLAGIPGFRTIGQILRYEF